MQPLSMERLEPSTNRGEGKAHGTGAASTTAMPNGDGCGAIVSAPPDIELALILCQLKEDAHRARRKKERGNERRASVRPPSKKKRTSAASATRFSSDRPRRSGRVKRPIQVLAAEPERRQRGEPVPFSRRAGDLGETVFMRARKSDANENECIVVD